MALFQKAVKTESKLRLAIAGPSGSGKTYTALAVGCALANGEPVALVDTEYGSASKYADLFGFDVANMHAPFHPDKFIKAINEAAAAGYKVIILDSLTHAYAGDGGLLALVDEAAKRSKSNNSYTAWKDVTPVQNRLIEAIVSAPIHIVATMRSKVEYVLTSNSQGKQEPKKVGMAPIQRDGFEYEFDVFLDMDIENNAIVQKTRCPELTGRVFSKPGADVADILRNWLQGAPVTVQTEATETQPKPAQPATNGAHPEQDFGGLGEAEGNPWEDDLPGDHTEEGAPVPVYIEARDKLTGNCAKLAEWARDKHLSSDAPASVKQYGFLGATIDKHVEDGAHHLVLSVLCRSEIDKNNRPGAVLATKLLDFILEEIKNPDNKEEKIPNPGYRQDYVDCLKSIYRLAQGQGELELETA